MAGRITRKDFLRGAAAGAVGIAGMGLLGGAALGTEGGGAPEASPGLYTAAARGFGGEVRVSLRIAEGQLLTVEAEGPWETEGLGSRAIALMPGQMLAKNSVAVDTVGGATITSRAILAAAAEALAMSGETLKGGEQAIAQHMAPGTYYGEAYGKWKQGSMEGERFFCPPVIEPTRVEVVVDESSILSVKVLETSETPGFYEPCVERIPAAVVAEQSITVDSVTGCTMTSQAILEGVTQALAQAGANLAGFTKASPKRSGEEVYETDLAIVGSGGAGTMAAITAMEAGKRVMVIEKCGKLGGLSACATSFSAVGSKMQKEAGIDRSIDEVFNANMNYCNWRASAPLHRNMLEHSAGCIDKLQEEYYGKTDYCGFTGVRQESQAHNQRKGTDKFDLLFNQFLLPGGVELLLECRATELILEEGAVVGLRAKRQNGIDVTVHAKAVFIATGGFGGNSQMLKEYLGNDHFYLNGVSRNEGDGINMCLGANAAMYPEICPHLSEYCGNDRLDYFSFYLKYINQPGFLALNPSGERFVNEQLFISHILSMGGSALFHTGYDYIIFTQDNLEQLTKYGINGILTMEELNQVVANSTQASRVVKENGYPSLTEEVMNAIAMGEAWRADSLEELGEMIGFDPEVYGETIRQYKEMIAKGEDTMFGKNPLLLHPLDDGPFYAVRTVNAIFGTFNGIRVNKNCQAMDGDYQPIPGLYVGGQDSGGFFSFPYYEGAGWTCGYAWVSGNIAAEHFAAHSD